MTTARRTLADVMRSHARTRGDALAFADCDVALSWRDAMARVHRAANALRAAGVGPGDRVLWLGQNSFRLQELLVACCEIGAAFCPANWRQEADELAFVIVQGAVHQPRQQPLRLAMPGARERQHPRAHNASSRLSPSSVRRRRRA